MTLLDDIQTEVSQLSDEDIAKAAAEIQAKREAAKARVTPDQKNRMKEREKHRRLRNSAILQLAKQKGLVPATE